MMLTEVAKVPDALLPVQAVKDHLRLGTGFSSDGMQDGLLAGYLRAALAAIEGRTGKALLTRSFIFRVDRWRSRTVAQSLPIAPVVAVNSVVTLDGFGGGGPIDPLKWRFVPDMSRPRIEGLGGLPTIPEGGCAEIHFDAGFGAAWSDVPPDLAQAVVLLSAEYYEQRHSGGDQGNTLPLPVRALIERWRTVRVLGGGSA
ncbi:head-tail connector protein [Thioclava sp. FR2]|uniref:head-tail connector protein n=1 Tax=Thioclava sp. FR2 TaxID=3445780 RepID=UPI003EB89DE8